MKKIVIIPTFGESHLIKLQIPNIIRTINPDIIIYNEGLFPKGPESRTVIDDNFLNKYVSPGTTLAFDTLDTQKYIKHYSSIFNKDIIHNEMKFEGNETASEAYVKACSNFEDLKISVNKGDIIFPIEPDVFHLDPFSDFYKSMIPDTAFKSVWIDYLETSYYIEKNNHPEIKPKNRKLCVCFGSMEYYKSILINFESQNYSTLPLLKVFTHHYSWFRYGKFKQLRFDQIVRSEQYWSDFSKGLDEIRFNTFNGIKDDVVMRPSVSHPNPFRYATYVNYKQPQEILNHPNNII